MDLALFLSALMLGAAGAPHCAAMCGPASASLLRGCSQRTPHALAAGLPSGARGRLCHRRGGGRIQRGALAQLGQLSPVLRPLWTLLHCAALGLGLWLLWQGRQPAWLENLGRGTSRLAPQQAGPGGWQRMHGPGQGHLGRASVGGLALRPAAVGAGGGGAGQHGLGWRGGDGGLCRGQRGRPDAGAVGLRPPYGGGATALQVNAWAVRLAGAALAAASAWAMGHDLIQRVVAYCLS